MISKFVNLILIILSFTQAIKLLDAFCRVPNTSDGPHHAGIPLGTCRLGRGAVAVLPVVAGVAVTGLLDEAVLAPGLLVTSGPKRGLVLVTVLALVPDVLDVLAADGLAELKRAS